MSENGKKSVADKQSLLHAYPKGVNWDIDIPYVDMMRIMDEAFMKYAECPALDFLGKKMTYYELGTHVAHAAKGLQEMGVGKGSKVGLFMPNTPYYPIMFMAALKVGATVVNYSLVDEVHELRHKIKDSGTDVMVTLDLAEFHDKTKELLDDGSLAKMVRCPMGDMLPTIKGTAFKLFKRKEIAPDYSNIDSKGILDLQDKDQIRELNMLYENYIPYSYLTANDGMYWSTPIDPEETAVLQYTGGTTGAPKGAMLSHFNLVANAHQIEEFIAQKPDREKNDKYVDQGNYRVIASIPYFHVFGMMVSMISSLKMGGELVILPNPRDMKATMKALAKHDPELFPAVPRLLQAISEDPTSQKYDFSGFGTVISGGAALAPDLASSFEDVIGKEDIIIQGYGLSETSPVATSNPAAGEHRNDTVGLPYPKTEVKITNPDDPNEVLPLGEIGEICIRGPQVMKGYYNKPEETAEVLTEDGWFRTGDLGYLEDDYYLKIVDRKKRLVIINGHNVYPTQIEKAIVEHPAVAEAIVIGIPDDRSGEAAKAFVRFHSDAEKPSEDEFRTYLDEHLNRWDRPKFIEFREEELPKTGVGKPDYKVLLAEELEKMGKDSSIGGQGPNAPKP